jgi:hypothetical protein
MMKQAPTRSVKVIEVVRVEVVIGDGTETHPYRTLTQFWSVDGELLAERDNWGPL